MSTWLVNLARQYFDMCSSKNPSSLYVPNTYKNNNKLQVYYYYKNNNKGCVPNNSLNYQF